MAEEHARWLALDTASAADLHAHYHGLAHAAAPGDPPLVLWARCTEPHICLGPHQDASAELALDGDGRAGGLPVLRREPGGGTVYVDGGQRVFAFVVPRARMPLRPHALFERLLPAVTAAYARLGLKVRRVGPNDLWAGFTKIGGTGAGTLGAAHVLVGSFLLEFPYNRFAEAVRCPSETFRGFLADGLREALAPWSAHGRPPEPEVLAAAFRSGLEDALGWRVRSDGPGEAERAAIAEARAELLDPDWLWDPVGRRAVAEGVKLKDDAYLTERAVPDLGRVTVQTLAGRIRRLDLAGPDAPDPVPAVGRAAEAESLAAVLPPPWARAVADVAVCDERTAARPPQTPTARNSG